MDTKGFIWLGLGVGSTVGGFLPYLWNGGLFSFIFFGAIGGIAGIWIAFRLTH